MISMGVGTFFGRNGLQEGQKFQPPSLPAAPIRRAENRAGAVLQQSIARRAEAITINSALGLKAAEMAR
jgi:hypothetical protein